MNFTLKKLKHRLALAMLAAGIVGTGATALHANTASAATLPATTQSVNRTVTINHPGGTVAVWDGISNAHATGQELHDGQSVKVVYETFDGNGAKWFGLGQNQWIPAAFTNADVGFVTTTKSVNNSVSNMQNNTQTTNYGQAARNYTTYSNTGTNHSYASASKSVNTGTTYNTNTTVSDSEASAKAYIVNRESGGSYSARNGQYIGKYQLSASYLHGDYSPANQERVAQQYMSSRYGSWSAAMQHHKTFGWW